MAKTPSPSSHSCSPDSGHDHTHDHGHSHEHDHSHDGHGHHHHHAPKDFTFAFAVGITLNFLFVIAEAGFGWYSNSLALLADAGHNLSDVMGLVLAWGASRLAQRKPNSRYTYGYRSSSILAALFNAVLLLLAIGGITWEAIQRLRAPGEVVATTVMIVAGIGIVINGATAMLFASGRKGDLNIRGAYLHMAADALVSLGVVVAGGVMLFTGWAWIDPVVSLIVSIVIVIGTWGLLKGSINLALAAVPEGIETSRVHGFLKGLSGVTEVHDLHIWGMSTTENALTAHLVMPNGHPGDEFLTKVAADLKQRHRIHHATLQIEVGDSCVRCTLSADDAV